MSESWSHLRYAFRVLVRRPAFTFLVVLILALGIGATSAVLSVIKAVMIENLPYPEPERIVRLQGVNQDVGDDEVWPASYPDCVEFRDATADQLERFSINSFPQPFNVLNEDKAERIEGEIVNAQYFPLLGVEPLMGRTLTAEEDERPGAPYAVILGYGFWQRRFGGERGVLGQNLVINQAAYEIIGVMPSGFRGISDDAEIWLPLTMANELLGPTPFFESRGVRWLEATARLRPGVEISEVQGTVDAVNAQLSADFPDSNTGIDTRVRTLREVFFGDLRFPLLTLFGAALFVLLIACTTAANMLMTRAVERQREIAIRASQGASRGRLIRQLLTESVVLAVVSAVVGLVLAYLTTRLWIRWSAVELRSFVDIRLDPGLVAAVVLVAALVGVAFGLAPAWLGTRMNFAVALREGQATFGRARQRFQNGLVVVEVALALFLLVGAGLMIKGFGRVVDQDLGFDPQNLLSMRIEIQGERYSEEEAMIQLVRRYLEKLEGIPGVGQTAIGGPTIPTDQWDAISHVVEDRMTEEGGGVRIMVFHMVSNGYFSTMGMKLVEGRVFNSADHQNSELVAVIDAEMAREMWPGQSAIGKRVRFGRRDPNAPWRTVVGVVGSLRNDLMQVVEWPGPDIYYPILQFPPLISPRLNIMIRPAGVPAVSLAAQVQEALLEVAPDLPPYDVAQMGERIARHRAGDRFVVLLMSFFAALAVVLSMVGLYGVISYSVTRRRREIGLRIALGSEPGHVVKLILRQAAVLVAVGLAIGVAAALGFGHYLESLLFGLDPLDPAIYAGTAVLLFTISLLAAWLPTRRALEVEPTEVLRAE